MFNRKDLPGVCHRCGQRDYYVDRAWDGRPQFHCNHCGNMWTAGYDGGEFLSKKGLEKFRKLSQQPPKLDVDAHNQRIIENAKYFTVVRFLGVGQYERHELSTKEKAVELAQELSNLNKGKYLVYAVSHDDMTGFVCSTKPKR